MTWFSSIIIGLLTAAFGCFAAAVVGGFSAKWYRVSAFEGGAGIYVLCFALFGGLAGLIIGIVSTRVGPVAPSFFKGLGTAASWMSALAVVAAFISWLSSDARPEIGGAELVMDVEVRCPVGFVIPTERDKYGAFAGITLPHGRHQPSGALLLEQAIQVDGRWLVSAEVPLQTTASQKYLRVYFNHDNDVHGLLPLRGRPNRSDLNWSQWISLSAPKKPSSTAEVRFEARYRVRAIEPLPEVASVNGATTASTR